MINFSLRKNALPCSKDISIEYTNAMSNNKQERFMDYKTNDTEEMSDIDKKNVELPDKRKINHKFEEALVEVGNSYKYQLENFDMSNLIVKLSDFDENKKKNPILITNQYAVVNHYIYKNGHTKECLRMRYIGFRKAFKQQICFYAMNEFPSILKIVGYSIHKGIQDLFVCSKENGTLKNVLENKELMNKMTKTNKLIIAYGVARAMQFLHEKRIVHRNLTTESILIDDKFNPFIFDFYCAKHVDVELPYELVTITPEFMAPELIDDAKSCQNSFKIDVYSYGIVLYLLFTNSERNPFATKSSDEILNDTLQFKRPPFLYTDNQSDEKWKELIKLCWNREINMRPSFEEISDTLENNFFDSSIDKSQFFDYLNSFKKK